MTNLLCSLSSEETAKEVMTEPQRERNVFTTARCWNEIFISGQWDCTCHRGGISRSTYE